MAKWKKLPDDPEGMNEERAAWAMHACIAFREACRGDDEDAIGDLIVNLLHLNDRSERFGGKHLNAAGMLRRALGCYKEETQPE